MTFKAMNLAVFRREPLPHVFFQPRFEPWFAWHEEFGGLPEALQGRTLREAYDLVGASMRSVHYYTGLPGPIETAFTREVTTHERRESDSLRRRYDTPFGPLFETERLTVDRTWRTVEFAAKTADDLPALRWLLERRRITFNPEVYRTGLDFVGDRGYAHFWVPKSPYLALAQQWMKLEDFIYAMADRPAEVEGLMRVIDDSYDALYEQLTACGPTKDAPPSTPRRHSKECASSDAQDQVAAEAKAGGASTSEDADSSAGLVRILNFGENIAMAHWSPRYFERYAIPWYEKRAGQLRKAGIFTHVHIDGYFRPLLPYLRHLPFDGLEALTPKPQGDVTLEEMHDHMGNKILLDGIPAVLFLDHHPREELEACVERIVELFHPRLVLGISDELPEAGGPEAFERLRWAAEYARAHGQQVRG